jgi:hypothetical protein
MELKPRHKIVDAILAKAIERGAADAFALKDCPRTNTGFA